MAGSKVAHTLGTVSLVLGASSTPAAGERARSNLAERARDGMVTAACHVLHFGWHRLFDNAFSGAHFRR